MSKPPHYRGPYHTRAAHLRAAAYADRGTRCWRCGRTLQEVIAAWNEQRRRATRRGTPPSSKKAPHWTAGHILDGDPQSPLAPECSPCNYSAGGKLRHAKRTPNAW